jgi:hypothetical protein
MRKRCDKTAIIEKLFSKIVMTGVMEHWSIGRRD